jgi:hypothetical protein
MRATSAAYAILTEYMFFMFICIKYHCLIGSLRTGNNEMYVIANISRQEMSACISINTPEKGFDFIDTGPYFSGKSSVGLRARVFSEDEFGGTTRARVLRG